MMDQHSIVNSFSRILKLSKKLDKLDVKSASKIYDFKVEVCPLKDTLMILDSVNKKMIATDNFISEHVYFNTEQYNYDSQSKVDFKCLFDAD